MPRSRGEIQKDVNGYRASVASRVDYLSTSYDPEAQAMQDKEKSMLIGFERELAEAKARGEKGRPLAEIRKDISEAEATLNKWRSNENGSTNPMQRAANHHLAEYSQLNINELQRELNEAIKESAEEEKAEIEKIKQSYEQEIRSNPNNAEVYIRRGDYFIARGFANGESQAFFNQAIADFTQAIKIAPNAKDAYLHRAELYSQIKDFDHAFTDFNQVIRIDPNNAEAYTFRAGVYTQQGKYDQALTDCNEAIRIDPKFPNAYSFRGSTYFAKSVQNKENKDYDNAVAYLDKAIADAEEALRLDSDNMANYLIKDLRNEKPIVERMRRERQEQYDSLVQKTNNASTENEFQDLTQQLREMRGFKDTAELAKKCDNRYQELKNERECKEAEQERKKKRKWKKGILLQLFLCAAYLFILYGTEIISEDGINFMVCLSFGIFSLAIGMVSLIFKKNSDSISGVMILIVMILVQSITICVWEGNVGFLFIYLIGRTLVITLCAIPGAILAYREV